MLNIQKLAHNSALLSGSDLWVLPGSNKSRWTKKIDWYLNFQISRANERVPQRPAPQILNILNENPELELTLPNPLEGDHSPLLVSSSKLLPNKQTLEVPYLEDPKAWVKQLHSIWLHLKQPSLRLFLPDGIDEDLLLKLWPSGSEEEEGQTTISVVFN